MGIRMSSNQFMYNYQVSLNKAYQNHAKLFEQADGASIHRPSDNAVDYSKLLRYNNSSIENDQYQRNVKNALSWMNTSDAALVHITDIMKTFVTKSVDASNDSNNDADFAAIAKEMLAEIQQVVAASNDQEGDRFIFSGQKDLVKPFSMSETLVNRGLAKTLDSAQTLFFKDLVKDEQTELTQFLTLQDKDQNYYYLDIENGSIYSKDFVDSGYKDALATGGIEAIKTNEDVVALRAGYVTSGVYNFENKSTYLPRTNTYTSAGSSPTYSSATAFKISDHFDNRGVLITEDENGNAVQTYVTVTFVDSEGNLTYTTLGFTTVSQQIVNYYGDDKGISMIKLNGAADPVSDTVNVTGADLYGRDIFDNALSGNSVSGCAMLNNMLTVYAKTNAGDRHWMSSDGITLAKVTDNTLNIAETKLGARGQLYNDVLTMLEKQETNITEDITNVSSTDVAKLAVQLMEMSTLYNMSLSMGGRILPQSLADYL